jgi:hypothetical protein
MSALTNEQELAAIRARHKRHKPDDWAPRPHCGEDKQKWPCDAAQVLDALDAVSFDAKAFAAVVVQRDMQTDLNGSLRAALATAEAREKELRAALEDAAHQFEQVAKPPYGLDEDWRLYFAHCGSIARAALRAEEGATG